MALLARQQGSSDPAGLLDHQWVTRLVILNSVVILTFLFVPCPLVGSPVGYQVGNFEFVNLDICFWVGLSASQVCNFEFAVIGIFVFLFPMLDQVTWLTNYFLDNSDMFSVFLFIVNHPFFFYSFMTTQFLLTSWTSLQSQISNKN